MCSRKYYLWKNMWLHVFPEFREITWAKRFMGVIHGNISNGWYHDLELDWSFKSEKTFEFTLGIQCLMTEWRITQKLCEMPKCQNSYFRINKMRLAISASGKSCLTIGIWITCDRACEGWCKVGIILSSYLTWRTCKLAFTGNTLTPAWRKVGSNT